MCGCFRLGLIKQGLLHDLSKYSPTEFFAGCKYYTGTRSPNDAQRMAVGYSAAWLHHKGRNKHHFEYWIDYAIEDKEHKTVAGMKMPKKYVAEMFVDRVAACKVYKKDAYTKRSPLEYYELGKDHMLIHKETKKQLEMLLTMMAEKGEDETFSYIKNVFLGKKRGKNND